VACPQRGPACNRRSQRGPEAAFRGLGCRLACPPRAPATPRGVALGWPRRGRMPPAGRAPWTARPPRLRTVASVAFPDRPLTGNGRGGASHLDGGDGVFAGRRPAARGVPRPGVSLRAGTAPSNSSAGGGEYTDGSSAPPSPSAGAGGPHPNAISSPSGSSRNPPRNRLDEVHYLAAEELPALAQAPSDRWVNDVLKRLGNTEEWSEQFGAIDDMRRLTRYAANMLVQGGQLRKAVSLINALADSLRSQLAKNGLRCIGEMYAAFGKRMDLEIEHSLPIIIRRAADTNSFIAEEAELSLKEVCKSASDAKLLPSVLTAAGNRQPRAREKAVWCLAMLSQRLVSRGACSSLGPSIRSVADATSKALGDSNPDVRQAARVAAMVLLAGGSQIDDCIIASRFTGAMIPGVDFDMFDAFDLECVQRCADLARAAGLFSSVNTSHRGVRSVGGMR